MMLISCIMHWIFLIRCGYIVTLLCQTRMAIYNPLTLFPFSSSFSPLLSCMLCHVTVTCLCALHALPLWGDCVIMVDTSLITGRRDRAGLNYETRTSDEGDMHKQKKRKRKKPFYSFKPPILNVWNEIDDLMSYV